MSEQNPYIVREEEGKAATIRDFVTGIPLKPDEMLPDEHGVHPVSPLGFLNKTDGADVTSLGVHGGTTGLVLNKVDDNVEEAYLKSYVVTGKYSVFTGRYIAFPLLSLTRPDENTLSAVVIGTVPTTETQSFCFRNTTSDDYSVTGLVGEAGSETTVAWLARSIEHDGDTTRIDLIVDRDIAFNGIVGAGKLDLCIITDKTYLCVTSEGVSASQGDGIYLPGEADGLPFRKVYSYGEIMPNTTIADMDLLVGYNSDAYNYLEYAHTDGTFTRLLCSRDNTDYFKGTEKVDCAVKHLTDVAIVNGLPLIRTLCYYKYSWHGPYLSTLVSSDGTKSMTKPYTQKGTPMKPAESGWTGRDCFVNALPDGDIYYEMSDAASYDDPDRYGLYNDLYLYFFNIKPKSGCYASNGYSDREVADWVRERLGPVIGYASHPYSMEGKIDGAGAFTRWFASCGTVDISGGEGKKQVNIPGFGLGAGYTGSCVGAVLDYPEDAGLAPGSWLTFGYGTKHDAHDSDADKAALPLDWPFTGVSSATEATENNITLVKDGVDVNGTVLGKLAEYDECATCSGTGMVDGEECPDCCGTGYAKSGNLLNRIHVCLYNDFSASDDTHGHTAGTTVLKKTFINLGTPLDTEDGDEFEITVSMPNVNLDQAFSSANYKSQSGYYAFISQPRAYVVSGTWKFSDTMVKVENPLSDSSLESEAEYGEITVDRAFEGIEDGTRIRFTVKSSGYPSTEQVLTGTLSGTGITLDGCKKVTLQRGMAYTICGAAYVEPNNDTLPEGSTPIGLNNVRNTDGALGDDYGTGPARGLQVYNRMYGVDDDDREQVIAQSDKRQIVATVYPTVTNTFAWELSGRKTLNNLDSMMTMDAEDGDNSIMAKVALMNRNILKGHQAFVDAAGGDFGLTPEYYPIDIEQVEPPEGEYGYSYIAKVLQVARPVFNDEGLVNEESNPVRQALKAVRMLASDYRNARVRTGSLDVSADDVFMREPKYPGDTWNAMFTDNAYAVSGRTDDTCDVDAQTIRLRNLAPVASQPASREDNTPVSPLLEMSPYVWQGEPGKTVSEYHAGNPYGYDEYSSTDALQETKCDFVNNTYGANCVGNNSVVRALLSKSPSWLDSPDAVDDLLRATEVAAVNLGNEVLQVYRRGVSPDWLKPFNAFAGLVSPDNIPVPSTMITDLQYNISWLGGDAYNYYYNTFSFHDRPEPFGLVATTMKQGTPHLTELANFLANYVPSYGADLPVRNWDSFRVKVPTATQTASDPVYLTRMKWYGEQCNSEFKGKYAADAFIGGTGYQDVNLNRTYLGTSSTSDFSHNYSATPYELGYSYNPAKETTHVPLNSEAEKGTVAYIRVFMKFTFSADAGRWYCTDYRQAPVGYLTPLYGAQALESRIGDDRVWICPSCSRISWKAATRILYGDYMPLDINTAVVDRVMEKDDDGNSMLMYPYKDISTGEGLGLGVPMDKEGTPATVRLGGQAANFWNVREHLRPATGALAGTDIPSYQKVDGEWVHGENGGIMSDAILWGQYDYPRKKTVEYHLPDVENPGGDT